MRARLAFAGVLAALVAAAAPSALADSTSVRDAKGDGPLEGGTGSVARDHDIRKAVAAHAKGGKLRHVVRVTDASRWTLIDTFIYIKAGGKQYRVGDKTVVRLSKGSIPGKRTGFVKSRRKGDSVIFEFKPKALGSPGSYRWRAETWLGMGRDLAPDSGRKRHRL